MVGTWKTVIHAVTAAELAVFIGTVCAAFLISRWPGSTANMSVELLLAILVMALPVVNIVVLFLFLPLQIFGKINVDVNYFVWGGALFGGVLYMSINMVIACFSGGNAVMQFFTTKAFVFPLVMGIIFSGLFCWFYKMLLKLWA
jgi:hypothetical protein